MTIHCTLSIRDESGSYYINAYITLLSLFENTKEKICVHILHDDTISHGKKDLEDLCAQYGQEIRFYRIPELDPAFVSAISRWFNIGTMYRYFVSDLIEADKVIYLDCDIIVNRDIKDLFDIPLGNHLVAAVKDNSHYWDKSGTVKDQYSKKIAYLNITPESCFEAGVMVINLARLRQLNENGNIFMQATEKALADGIDLHYPDQDIMNSVCASLPEGLLLLDSGFNAFHNILHLSLDEMKGKIIQFIDIKQDGSFFPGHLVFWKYYALSPFSADMIARMDAAFQSRQMAFMQNYLLHPKRRRKASDYLESGFVGMLLKAVTRGLNKRR